MLVLSRRINQVIIVGDIRIMIVDVRNGTVRVGIDAPKEMKILREELVPDAAPVYENEVHIHGKYVQ